MILDAIDDILAVNGASLNVYFKTLQPLELQGDILEEEKEELSKVELGDDSRPFLDDELAHEMLDALADLGEEEPEGYELIDAEEVGDEEPEDFDVESYLNGLVSLSATQDSNQDTELYKVRYRYSKGTSKTPMGQSRTFCKTMMSKKMLYRKEDIGQMSARGVNKSFGHKGRNYSLFKYKGGVNCYHRWERRIYKKKIKERRN